MRIIVIGGSQNPWEAGQTRAGCSVWGALQAASRSWLDPTLRAEEPSTATAQRAPSPPTTGRGCQEAGRWREGARKPQSRTETAAALFCSFFFFSPPRGQTSPPHSLLPPLVPLLSALVLKVLTLERFAPPPPVPHPQPLLPARLPPKVPKKERCKVWSR